MPQRFAADPGASAWVSASAGTGKTKVLTDRVLRLLLPRADGAKGTAPHKILCLTFTKAAASEMALRIGRTLGEWAVMPEDRLATKLADLLGGSASGLQMAAAQRLFAEVVDAPGGLQIMTIHSFCQSVLGRFPLEAGLPPHFTVLDEAGASALMVGAQNTVLAGAQKDAGSPLHEALGRVAGALGEEQFAQLVRSMLGERYQLRAAFGRFWDADGIYAEVCRIYGIMPGLREEDYLRRVCADGVFDGEGLHAAGSAMVASSKKTDVDFGARILRWLGLSAAERFGAYQDYRTVFLKADGDVRVGNFPTSQIKTAFPACEEILRAESARLMAAERDIYRIRSAFLTRDLLLLGVSILEAYEGLKDQGAALDFDDLIIRTLDLLRGESGELAQAGGTAWIMYKLDQGLDHILVDEAQDTNPEQWKIIEALCDEFFSGSGARDDALRTAFTVGDMKQSIYSFQRAAPEEFRRMRGVFDEKITQAALENRDVALDISFRSTAGVLALVDAVFDDDGLTASLGGARVRHESFRAGQAGRVELWPLFATEKDEKEDLWTPLRARRDSQSGAARMADYTAAQVRRWLDEGEVLPAYGRVVRPGDIMILVRSRGAFVDQLVRALKLRGVPVSGVDRMMLGEQLAVQDLLALGQVSLLPEDDLTLACVLKSPLIGVDEDSLFDLAYGRTGRLWAALLEKADGGDARWAEIAGYLRGLQFAARSCGVYEFFSFVLNTSCPGDARSGLRALKGRLGEDAADPVDELMNAALSFGRSEIDSLQLFLDAQARRSQEIKRELEEAGGCVRIMTVHGSKGLQAPIVILPDTVLSSSAKKPGRLLWPDKTGRSVPLWSARAAEEPPEYGALFAGLVARQDEEYHRLLYVAMTRAADRLYVGGYCGKSPSKDGSWYYLVQRGMARLEGVEEIDEGVLRYDNPQEAAPDKAQKGDVIASREIAGLPDWLMERAPDEPMPPRPLVPSRPSVEEEADLEPAALSPLADGGLSRFRRGNLTHKLLQFLPDFEEDRRFEAARRFLAVQAADLSQAVRDEIVQEVLAILNDPRFVHFFKAGSFAEVPVSALMEDGRIVSGQIDRLAVGERDVWIVDYKTNRPPPRDAADVPAIYRKQLAAYKDAIAAVYPGRAVHCALLWTDGPFLTEL
ncbi:MAG: double-strand break repair helicase AddA [Alphaproteobacteria bacterium]|nr:double-strand break repair helicase AddA [Alphaproteobacteria bacterium]